MKARKIVMYNKKGRFVGEYENMYEASQETGTPRATIYSQCSRESKGFGDYYFRFKGNKESGYIRSPIIELDLSGNFIKEYETQSDCAKEHEIHVSTVNSILHGRMKGKGYRLMYKNDYDKLSLEPKQVEIKKSKSKEYFVNVLVGLANGTLVDGATYEINGTKMKYSKENNGLMVADKRVYSYDSMWEEVPIELPILLPSEKEFLSNLLKAFSNAKGIVKCKDRRDGFEFIRIETPNQEETITLPSFIEGKYYKSLQRDTLYSLKDLELS